LAAAEEQYRQQTHENTRYITVLAVKTPEIRAAEIND